MSVTAPRHTTPPPRTHEQRMAALNEGNRIRTWRAQLKREVARNKKTITQTLDHPDLQTMKVIELLIQLPKVGRVKAGEALRRSRVSPSKTVAGLTPAQRDLLLSWLNGR